MKTPVVEYVRYVRYVPYVPYVPAIASVPARPAAKVALTQEATSAPLITPSTADARPVPALLALPLSDIGALAYAFVIDGQRGEAALRFDLTGDRYTLRLAGRAGDRDLPQWHSEGRVRAYGLQPKTHLVRRRGRERERLRFDHDAATPALLVGPHAVPLPAGMQDRLSWGWRLSAMPAAEPEPAVGLRLRVPVAGSPGMHDWDFEVVARDHDRWLLRRELVRGPRLPVLQWSAWFEGQRGFLPVELRFSLDGDEQWALRLLE